MIKIAISLFTLLLVSQAARADLVLLNDNATVFQSIFRGWGPTPVWTQSLDTFLHTNRTGQAILNTAQTEIALSGVGFKRPAHQISFTNQTVKVDITVNAQSWTMADTIATVTSNVGNELTTTGHNMNNFVASNNLTGTWKLTGFNGTIIDGVFDIPSVAQTSQLMGSRWDVGSRSGNPVVGLAVDVTGHIGVGQINQPGDLLFDGVIDSVPFKLEFLSQTNEFGLSNLYPGGNINAVPEPSGAIALLLGGVAFVGWRRTRLQRVYS